jgi:hypothetical protein
MNFLSSDIPQAEEYNAALMVEKICDLEKAESLEEQDLEQLTLHIFSAGLRKERLQDIMHTLGAALVTRKEDDMKERGECLLNAAYAKRQLTEHSLPDNGTSTLIMGDEDENLQNSIIAIGRKKQRVETEPVSEDEPLETENDLEPSGIFSDEREVIPVQETEKVQRETNIEEESAPITPEYAEQLITLHREKITGAMLAQHMERTPESSLSFSQFTASQPIKFDLLQREEVLGEIKYLLSTIDYFFRKLEGNPASAGNKTFEMNFTSIQKILQIERKIFQQQEEWLNLCEILTKKQEQFSHLEEVEEELKALKEKNMEALLPFIQSCFITSLKELFHEQPQFPEEIERVKKDLTALSEELFALQIKFAGKE